MKPIQKYIILIIGLSLFLLLGYIGFQNNDSSQLDESLHTETNTNPHINTGANNTPKPSTTLSVDTNIWGGNPFQTGSTSTGELTKPETPKPQTTKVVFQKPNTEWKSRTLSGITYVFGEGNPKEVALSVETMQQEFRQCEITPGSMARICRDGMAGYVSPEIERALKQVLESPLWGQLINLCSSEQRLNPGAFDKFNKHILAPGALDISRFLIIDPDTGRKELAISTFNNIYSAIVSVGADINDPRNDTGVRSTEGIFYPCVEQYGKPLADRLENIKVLYMTTLAYVSQDNRFPTASEISQSLNNGLLIPFFINP
ncbi:hypothetical protein K2X92_01105 [Candidatus Gracilibacteria bacterium]|nr:hypothetical protein [Candidatus Gracilibacteria bacterium]